MSPKKKKLEPPPEHSVWLRLVGCITSVVGVGAACAFVETTIPAITLFIWGTICGNYISYHYRNKNPWWLIVVFLLGFVVVTAFCLNDLISMFEFGQLALLTPVVHYFAGVLVIHTFELRTRADIYTSQLMGLIVLATAAPLCKSMVFGALVLAYVCLGALFFFIDARTRYGDEAEKKQSNLFAISFVQRTKFRPSTGSTIASLIALPLASVLLFMLLPRFDLNELLNKWLNPKPEKINVPQNFAPKANEQTYKDPNKTPPKSPKKKPEEKKKPPEPKKPQEIKRPEPLKKKEVKKQDKKKKPPEKKKEKAKEELKVVKDEKEKAKKVEKKKHVKRKLDGGATNDYPVNASVTISQEFKPTKDLVMKIRCTRAAYVTRDFFDQFDGETWTKSETGEPQQLLKPDNRSPFDLSHANALKLPDDFPATDIFEEFMIAQDMTDSNISFEGIPQKTDYPTEMVGVTPYGSLLADGPVKAKTNYKLDAKFGIYDFDKMRVEVALDEKTEEYFREKYHQYLQTPDEQDSAVSKLAFTISDPAPNWFSKAEEVANYLRKGYTYDLSKKGEEDQDNPVDYFLFHSKKGDCKDFASAFVIMTRHLGIPARIVTGFVPGKINEVTSLREVRHKDAHMWAQVYIPGYEWIDFDATPGAELPEKPKEKQYDMKTITGHQIDWKKLWWLIVKYGADILAILITIALALFIRHKILAFLAKRREAMQGTLARRLYLRIFSLLKKNAKITKATTETYKEFTKRLAEKNAELMLAGKPCYPTIPDPLDLFLAEYAAVYFGKKKDTKVLETHARNCLDILNVKPSAQTGLVRAPKASNKNGGSNGRKV